MRKYLFAAILLGTDYVATAQTVMTYYDGRPAFEKKLTNVEGSELLYEDWLPGQVTTADGIIYNVEKLKYNQLEDQFYFVSDAGVSMLFITPIQEVVLSHSATGNWSVFRNGFPAIARFTPKSFFEVLADGKNALLKKTVKTLVETKEFNSPVKKLYIQKDIHYYFFNGEKLFPVKKDKGVFAEGNGPAAAAIESYIKANKPNFKNEQDLVKLVQHINSLQ